MHRLRLGTSAFTAAGWPGSFYPADLPASDYLSFYAQHFDAVEVDSTFYRIPNPQSARNWYACTPKNFFFAAKAPQSITHEHCLVDCDDEMKKFLAALEPLGEKLGALLFQFPYFNRRSFGGVEEFLERLVPFLKKLPQGTRYAVEVRNKNWLVPKLLDALRAQKVALALLDHPWMPRPHELTARLDPVTADFTYIRWLGDRKGIEERTKSWDKVIVDRRRELEEWVDVCREFARRRVNIYAFANNHYAGHAPATVRLFQDLWKKKGGAA
jgi:uncharacterized protein YecE (DUF72 family)